MDGKLKLLNLLFNLKMHFQTNIDEATQFKFVVAPNTEIKQIRFTNGGQLDYVLTWKTDNEFEDGKGAITAQPGYLTDPLKSCFKIYRFLSNVYNRGESIHCSDYKIIHTNYFPKKEGYGSLKTI